MVGNQPSFTPNSERSSSAATNAGAAAPTVTRSISTESVREPRRSAPIMPAATPTTAISRAEAAISSIVAGSRDQMTELTSWWKT